MKTENGSGLKFCMYVPKVKAIKSGAGISIILLFAVFISKKGSKIKSLKIQNYQMEESTSGVKGWY